MSITVLIAVLCWLVVGWAWTYYWYNHILDNKRWGDTGEKVGGFGLLMMNLVGPAMAALLVISLTVEFIFTKIGPFIKKMYGG